MRAQADTRLGEIAALFLKLGTIAFGGPAAHIAMMEDEVVRRRRWLTRDEFLDLIGAVNLIPGPNSTELAIHIGYRQARWPGLLVAGACFIIPATLIVSAIAWAYVRFGQLPTAGALMYGVKPIIIAIVAQALVGLGRTAVKTPTLGVLAIAALVLCVLRVNEIALLLIAGVAAAAIATTRGRGAVAVSAAIAAAAHATSGTALRAIASAAPMLRASTPASESTVGVTAVDAAGVPITTASATVAGLMTAGAGAAAAAGTSFSLTALFLFFLKVGSVLFGSGYVLLAFLRADLVERWGWLTNAQLLDAVAVGQITPGPLFTTATFIGYVLAGPAGAVVATVGIFAPAFLFVAISGPLVPRLRRSRTAGAFLDGVNVASLALMAFVTYELARAALIDPLTVAMAVVAGLLLVRWRINSAWLVIGGALIGLVSSP